MGIRDQDNGVYPSRGLCKARCCQSFLSGCNVGSWRISFLSELNCISENGLVRFLLYGRILTRALSERTPTTYTDGWGLLEGTTVRTGYGMAESELFTEKTVLR